MPIEEIEVETKQGREKRLVIDPMENVLIGSDKIMRYCRISSVVTMYQWVELYGFPAIKRPDGAWMSTCTSIDQWIFLAAELDNENRPFSRGYGGRHEIALARLQGRIEAAKNNVTTQDQNSLGVAYQNEKIARVKRTQKKREQVERGERQRV